MALNAIQNDPVFSLPFLYISGLNLSVASTTVLAIAPGQARDQNNQIDMPVGYANLQGVVTPAPYNYPASSQFYSYNPYNPFQYASYNSVVQNGSPYPQGLFISTALNGANGLDTGTIAASSKYVVWLIGDSRGINPVAGILSLFSNAFPTLPLGYDSYRQLGFVSTNGSSQLTSASLLNMVNAKSYYLSPAISVLSGGASATFAAAALNSAIPTTTAPFVQALLSVSFTPNVANDTVQIRPTGSTATSNLATIVGQTALTPQQQYIQVFAGVSGGQPSIDYKVTSTSDSVSISVVGYTVTLS